MAIKWSTIEEKEQNFFIQLWQKLWWRELIILLCSKLFVWDFIMHFIPSNNAFVRKIFKMTSWKKNRMEFKVSIFSLINHNLFLNLFEKIFFAPSKMSSRLKQSFSQRNFQCLQSKEKRLCDETVKHQFCIISNCDEKYTPESVKFSSAAKNSSKTRK